MTISTAPPLIRVINRTSDTTCDQVEPAKPGRVGQAVAAYPEGLLLEWHALIHRACLCAGFRAWEAEDTAQDVLGWVVEAALPADVITVPWLKGVAHIYILRHRQRMARWREREGRRIEAAPEPWAEEAMPTLESKELLNRVSAILPKRERALLALIRQGYALPEASRMIGIPDGSRDYCQGRIVAYARRLLRRQMQGAVPRERSL